MHAPQSLDHGNKSKSMSTSFLPPINNHYRRAFCNSKANTSTSNLHISTFQGYHATLFLNAELLLVDTACTSLLSVRIAPPICFPASANQRGSPVRLQSIQREFVASPDLLLSPSWLCSFTFLVYSFISWKILVQRIFHLFLSVASFS